MTFTLIGNLSNDEIHIGESIKRKIGGSVLYASLVLTSLQQKVKLFTNYSAIPDYLHKDNVQIQGNNIAANVHIKIFEEENKAYADSYGEEIEYKKIPHDFLESDCILISPLFSEVSYKTLQKIVNSAKSPVALDVQGYLRTIDEHTKQVSKRKIDTNSIKGIDIVKLNEEEATILYPSLNYEQMAKALIANGQKVCLFTLGEKGAMIFDTKTVHRLQIPSLNPKDTVGAGDTFFAAFLKDYLYTENIAHAGNNAIQYVYSYLKNKSYE